MPGLWQPLIKVSSPGGVAYQEGMLVEKISSKCRCDRRGNVAGRTYRQSRQSCLSSGAS